MILDEEIENSKGPELTDTQIFTEIWTSPKKVFRFLTEYEYNKHTVWLMIVGGALEALERNFSGSGSFSIWLSVIGGMVLGAALGWIGYWIAAFLIGLTGKWIGGKGSTTQLLRVVAYATLPNIPAAFLLIPLIIIFGEGVFADNIDIYQNGYISGAIYWSFIGIQLVLGIWGIVITVAGVSVVQNLSPTMAFANLLLAFLVVAVPLLIIVLFIAALS
jgi:hypothetical protein